ncbi:cyclase family protein [Kribbella sp. NPDC048915]|uniref:cyclase family protein n=1 Tax=Kribbella sp. NPDC048915 TaxID=3155148 RepID=UPI0033D62765
MSGEHPATDSAPHPDWLLPWRPPAYEVDANGKVAGAVAGREPHNWGRWGELDQLGTLNLITDAARAHALGLATTGRVVSCSIPIDEQMPVHPTRPLVVHTHALTGTDLVAGGLPDRESGGYPGADDYIFMPLQSATHWDGLTHCSYQDTFYNGFWVGTAGSNGGARVLSTHLLTDRIAGRGVLLDVARYRGVSRLLPGAAIEAAELDACAAAQGVDVRSGDLLLVRTGELGYFYRTPAHERPTFFDDGHPGLALDTVAWLHRHEVAALAMDNRTIEVVPWPAGAAGEPSYPVHSRLIRDLGLTIGELWWLDHLADTCAEVDRWEFFLAATPLPVRGASGVPTSPLAFF